VACSVGSQARSRCSIHIHWIKNTYNPLVECSLSLGWER
jgi:hypothetical protein